VALLSAVSTCFALGGAGCALATLSAPSIGATRKEQMYFQRRRMISPLDNKLCLIGNKNTVWHAP